MKPTSRYRDVVKKNTFKKKQKTKKLLSATDDTGCNNSCLLGVFEMMKLISFGIGLLHVNRLVVNE